MAAGRPAGKLHGAMPTFIHRRHEDEANAEAAPLAGYAAAPGGAATAATRVACAAGRRQKGGPRGGELPGRRSAATDRPGAWTPALNFYRCESRYVVCVDMAEIDAASMRFDAEPHRVVIRGSRPRPEQADPCLTAPATEPDGERFERAVVFPLAIETRRVEARLHDGALWVEFPLSPARGGRG